MDFVVYQTPKWQGKRLLWLISMCDNDSRLRQGDNWNELLKEVISFDSVEDFWGIYVCA